MQDILFYTFSSIVLLGGLCMVLCRSPITSAMFMIVSFTATAALFVLLEAYLLAALQILVYAGAVMVLVLFILMLLDIKKAKTIRPHALQFLFGLICAGALSVGVYYLFTDPAHGEHYIKEAPYAAESAEQALNYASSVRSYGYGLFTEYMLPVQVTAFLLLVAMVGVIVVSKRPEELNTTDNESA